MQDVYTITSLHEEKRLHFLGFRTYQTYAKYVKKMIKKGMLKAIVTGTGSGTRYLITKENFIKFIDNLLTS